MAATQLLRRIAQLFRPGYSAADARVELGLGTAATQAATSFAAAIHGHPVTQIGTGTPAAGKYLDGGGAWTTLPGGADVTPGGVDGSVQINVGGAFSGGADIAKVGTGRLSLNSQFGQWTIVNDVAGSGLVLVGNGGTAGYASLRIIANTEAWADNLTTAYFQIDAPGRNATFLSGGYGADVPFNRFQIVAGYTTVYSSSATSPGYNATPVPIGTFNVVNGSPDRPGVAIVGDAGQSSDLVEYRRANVADALSGVDAFGYVRSRVGSGPPGDAAREGSMYLDATNSQFHVRVGGAWKKVALT